jgi:hypothetical protein
MKFSASMDDETAVQDALRMGIVLSMSAYDHYIHEIIFSTLISSILGIKPFTLTGRKISISVLSEVNNENRTTFIQNLQREIKDQMSHESYMDPDKLNEAMNSIGISDILSKIAIQTGESRKYVRENLKTLTIRRNVIVHNSDYADFSTECNLQQISRDDAGHCISLLSHYTKIIDSIV